MQNLTKSRKYAMLLLTAALSAVCRKAYCQFAKTGRIDYIVKAKDDILFFYARQKFR